jgi:ribonucleoside-diphosphate reductase alpha subunit
LIKSVIKRNNEVVEFDPNKLNKWAEWASESKVSWSEIVMSATKKLSDMCSTKDIHKALIDTCLEKATYQHADVAARLLVGEIYKEVFGDFVEPPSLFEFYIKMVESEKWIDMGYVEEELDEIDSFVIHNKDFGYQYSSLRQMCDKYMLKNKHTGQLFESPQFMYVGIALAAMQNQPQEHKVEDVIKLYTYLSDLKINVPTPTLSGMRTKFKGYASCCLFTTNDTAESIEVGSHIAYMMTCASAGIGGYMHTRSVKDPVRGGDIVHYGKLPYLRYYESAVKSTKQAVRGGSATMHINIMDPEIEDLIRLKHPTTPTQKQIRGLDYSNSMNKLFIQKVAKNEQWMLISPYYAQDLYDKFYSSDYESFVELYDKYDKSDIKEKKYVNARELAIDIQKNWRESGRTYKTFIDEINRHTPFKESIYSSNLCQEITLPTKGFKSIVDLYGTDGDAGEVALCFIGAIVAGRVTSEEYEDVAYYTTLLIDNTIDLMEYPFPQMEVTAKARRSIGVGIVNLANYLASQNAGYTSNKGKRLIHELAEMHSYYMHKASLRLAKEKGNAEWIGKTKYPEGWLPIDTYNKNVDNVVDSSLVFDWEQLRQEIIKQGGLRNSVLEAHMPGESSSLASNTTNGLYPIRSELIIKSSDINKIPVFVPDYDNLITRYSYEKCWDVPFKDMVNMYAIVQKFCGQSISADFYFDTSKYEDGKIGTKEDLTNLLYMCKMGLKTHYYSNTKSKSDAEIEQLTSQESGCASGGCSL